MAFDEFDEADSPNKKKILSINRETEDGISYEYKVNWVDIDVLPTKVTDNDDEPLYLTINRETKEYEWTNKLLANQSFIYRNKKPTYDEVSTNLVIFDNINFNQETENLIIFKNSLYVSEPSIQVGINVLGINLEVEEEDLITLIIIRNTATDILDKLESQYLTKEEAIRLITNGTINLSTYAKKTDLATRSLKNHYHSQYSSIDHDHDGRYADYHHLHTEYATHQYVSAQIGSILELNPEVIEIIKNASADLENIFSAIVGTYVTREEFDNNILRLDTELSNRYTKEEIDGILSSNEIRTDHVRTTIVDNNYQGSGVRYINLAEYISTLNDHINELTNFEQQPIEITNTINVGVDLGKYHEGDIITSGTLIETVINNILTKDNEEFNVLPQLYGTLSVTDVEDHEIEEDNFSMSIDISNSSFTKFLKKDTLYNFNFHLSFNPHEAGDINILYIKKNGVLVCEHHSLTGVLLDYEYHFETEAETNIALEIYYDYDIRPALLDGEVVPHTLSKPIYINATVIEPIILNGIDYIPSIKEVENKNIKVTIKGENYSSVEIKVPKSLGTVEDIIYLYQHISVLDDFSSFDEGLYIRYSYDYGISFGELTFYILLT
jgi:hypothetical protein